MINLVKVLRYLVLIVLLSSANLLCAQITDPVIPNIFTPNGDNINDTYTVSGLTGSWTLHIYDRWGNLIFSTERVSTEGWDGFNLLGIEAVTGVYFYILKQQNADNSYNGTIQLSR
jgi:gliding motility-associated-like protein